MAGGEFLFVQGGKSLKGFMPTWETGQSGLAWVE